MPHIALPEDLPGITSAFAFRPDAVLIAAAFCMYNRDADGLATLTPTHHEAYDRMGQRMAREGYVR